MSFSCQSCRYPLVMSSSFKAVEASIASSTAAASSTSSFRSCDTSGGTVSSSTVSSIAASRAESTAALEELFDRLSGSSTLDHPLCHDCAGSLIEELSAELKLSEDMCAGYNELLATFSVPPIPDTGTRDEELAARLAAAHAEEAALDEQLAEVSAEKERTAAELAETRLEYSALRADSVEAETMVRSLESRAEWTEEQLTMLKRTSALNAAFHIWHSGHFGTINGLRLGTLRIEPVKWDEINAAWGQAALLLSALAQKLAVKFQHYTLHPMGSFSYLVDVKTARNLPLHGQGGPTTIFFWDTGFDAAMVAFLNLLAQFKAAVEKGWKQFNLPYEVVDGGLKDPHTRQVYSIKMQMNSQEHWTKALKLMLTNLKWGITWVAAMN